MGRQELIDDINRIKKEKNAVILVHNYQRPEIYEVADFMGDSLGLSKEAARTEADIIVFCGVMFMAETAKTLSPEKTVLIPNMQAGCPMADMATVEQVREMRRRYPKAVVVSYVNTSADVKAESDICCTSANAVEVVNSLNEEEVIFVPDKNLGSYVQSKSDKKIHLWDGFCHVHDTITEEFVLEAKKNHPGARIIAHPECNPDVLKHADYICSTSGMAKFAKEDSAREFIILTESGMLEALKREVPEKIFYSCGNVCTDMEKIDLESVKESLTKMKYEVGVPEEIRAKARKAIDRMLEIL